jgi:pimeloyl-ACP methyl ester carboxylesterase
MRLVCCSQLLMRGATVQCRRFSHASIDGVTLHFAEAGHRDAPRVVLLHGGGANLHWWNHLIPELARDHNVVALDFRGHGDSDHPDALEVGAFHRDLEALLAHLGSPECSLVGHSLGAHVALHHAATQPGIQKLVLVEPSRGAGHRERRRSRLALAARRTYASLEEAIERFRFLPDAPGVEEDLRRSVARHSVRREADGRYGFKFDPRWFSIPAAERPDLGGVQADTLVLRGGDSTLLSSEGARALCSELPRSKLLEIPKAGHNVHVERPAEVLAALTAHLRGDRHSSEPTPRGARP